MPLRRKKELRAKARIRAVSKKRLSERGRRKAVREAVFKRDGECLLSPWRHLNAYGNDWGPCFGDPFTFHHLRKASQGGEYTEDNGITLCAGHNDMIEDYPKAARAIGLVRTAKDVILNGDDE